MNRTTWLGAAVAAALLSGAPAFAVEPDKLMPAETTVAVGIDFRQTLDSPVMKKNAVDTLKLALQGNPEVTKLLEKAGLDPFRDIDSILLCSTGTDANSQMRWVIRGKFDPTKVDAALQEAAKKDVKGLKVKSQKEDGVAVYEVVMEDQSVFAAFADNKTLILAEKAKQVAAAVKGAANPPAKLNKDMATALGRVDGKSSVWVALVVTDDLKKQLKANPFTQEFAPKLDSVTGTVHLTQEIDTAVTITTKDAESAKQLGKTLDELKPQIAGLIDNPQAAPIIKALVQNLKIISEQSDVKIHLKVTEDTIKKALDMDK